MKNGEAARDCHTAVMRLLNRPFLFVKMGVVLVAVGAPTTSAAIRPGSVDESFVPATPPELISLEFMGLQPDGKIVLSGGWSALPERNLLFRLNKDGSFDRWVPRQVPAGWDSSSPKVMQPDGKIVEVIRRAGSQEAAIVRFNTDGSLDASFSFAETFPSISWAQGITVVVAGDKVVVGGEFTSFGGRRQNNILRLNRDGDLDLAFNPGTGPDKMVTTAHVDVSGKVLIGGWFTSVGGVARRYVARLNADGSLDESFDAG
jgi:uncharacterized delta-60 repeat protein